MIGVYMIDALNDLIYAFSYVFQKVFSAPLYGSMTWGWFLIATTIMGILITYFVSKLL